MRRFAVPAVAAATLSAALLMPAVAEATPGSGVTQRTISRTTIGDTDYILVELTLAPGASTGWHSHPGPIYSSVRSGTLTHDLADCHHEEAFSQGETFVDHAKEVHLGRNLGTTKTVLIGLAVLPHGAPFGADATDPGCGFR
ncbi:cupin domain-containing protein [Amycolatopsis sp. NPDC051903]|uniref:cupin domain-containing protein n=1 Tax=Amycolatopsis sp. NPDC051903 TaxID=3363936 RepID=UPI0037A875F6